MAEREEEGGMQGRVDEDITNSRGEERESRRQRERKSGRDRRRQELLDMAGEVDFDDDRQMLAFAARHEQLSECATLARSRTADG